MLPFQNMSGDPEQDYFADGVVEDMITALSRFRSFAVIARNSSFVYKGRAVDVRQVARELGVRYVLEGSVRRAGNRLRITAQLVEGTTGNTSVGKQIRCRSSRISSTCRTRSPRASWPSSSPQIQRAELDRSRRKRPESLDAYDLYLQALPKMNTRVRGRKRRGSCSARACNRIGT